MLHAAPKGPSPKTLGRYELLFRVASGGMAEVYAARVNGEAGFQKLVAVKKMLPTLVDDPEFVSMFLDEARLAANISSPHVVQTMDLGRDADDGLFIAMELVVGSPLSRIMQEAASRKRAVPVAMAIEILAQAALGLHAAHVATTPTGDPLHIIHRDISPQNILLGVDGRARITDFGVARAVMRMTKTDAGRIKGKFAYCAPEQLSMEEIDQRADLFSLGIVAWELLAGQRLFVADHPMATMQRVQSMPILPLTQVRSRVPQEVSAVIDRALQREVSARWPSAHDFAEALRDAAKQGGLTLPTASEIGAFVKAAGGEPLAKMRANIQAAVRGDALRIDTGQYRAIVEEELDSGAGLEAHSDAGSTHSEARPIPFLQPDDSHVSRTPGSLMIDPNAAPAPARPWASKRAWVWAGVLMALCASAIGVGLALSERGGATLQIGGAEPSPLPDAAQPTAIQAPIEPAPGAEGAAEDGAPALEAVEETALEETALEAESAEDLSTDEAAPERATPIRATRHQASPMTRPSTASMASASAQMAAPAAQPQATTQAPAEATPQAAPMNAASESTMNPLLDWNSFGMN